MLKEFRQRAGLDVGDTVVVVLRRDEAPRELSVPAELEAALAGAVDATQTFDALAFTHHPPHR